ncbi:DUF7848 domain-containing protein [Streptomyces nojiriensis]|uniref:DUF7848 domain-containing protein n=1 Tax=Streptomyces nojiriensis TaxID=66374 RepID=UPI00406488F3
MRTRAVLRFTRFRMRRHPSAKTTAAARCLNPGCDWHSTPPGNADECSDMCIAHTGRTGLLTFVREFSEVAVVERVQ